jgi:hypothetical protein
MADMDPSSWLARAILPSDELTRMISRTYSSLAISFIPSNSARAGQLPMRASSALAVVALTR